MVRLEAAVFCHNQVITAALCQQIENLDALNSEWGWSNAYD